MRYRRLLQFNLRTFLCVVTVLAVLMGLVASTLGPYLPEYRREQAAIAELVASQASGTGLGSASVTVSRDCVGPSWLHDLFGREYFSRVVEVSLKGDVTDEDFRWLNEFRHLKHIEFDLSALTDAGLKRLKDLSQLKSVGIIGGNVTWDGIEELERARPDLIFYGDD